MSARLPLAFPSGAPEGEVLLLGADAQADLSPFDRARSHIVQTHAPAHAALAAQGWRVSVQPEGAPAETVIVFLPRARDLARARLAEAVAHLAPGGTLWVDGLKTDGIEAALRELRGLATVDAVEAKAHGKIFRITGAMDWLPATWAAHDLTPAPGFVTRPGVFSADGVDPGSAMLAAHLPERLPARVVDLGAGWGWLSAQILARPGVEVLHLVESDAVALDCARHNVTDPRARFHWADATSFTLPDPVNGVVMNPPFHDGSRSADPRIGAAFIAAAAGLLTGAGRLWMVANRHLPYEAILAQHFAQVEEIGGDGRFKIITATGAGRARPATPTRRRRR